MLAQASYLVGCGTTGEALVVDPNRAIDQYQRVAAAEQLRITHVTETHIHADFVSGARELAARTGARLLLSAEGGSDWRYAHLDDAGAVGLRNGDQFRVGRLRFDVLHTPGHSPEHVVFVVTDTAAADEPMGVFTGDFLFVGDVGRPDLLELAAGGRGTINAMASALFNSLARLQPYEDWLQIWPGHGAGSACGKSLGAVPSTTLGYERRFNWAFGIRDEAEFVRVVLAGQPDPPPYFARMKALNREGPPAASRGIIPGVPLDAAALEGAQCAGACVIDTRSAGAYAAGHVAGSIAVPHGRSFLAYAGNVVPYERPLVLLIERGGLQCALAMARQLALIGLDSVAGWAERDVLDAWTSAGGRALASIDDIDRGTLSLRSDFRVLDVRDAAEWKSGHIPGALHVPLARLASQGLSLDTDAPIVVTCETGTRSVIAAGLLQAAGFRRVRTLSGGTSAWRAAGLPIE